jgi:hypothetical protein
MRYTVDSSAPDRKNWRSLRMSLLLVAVAAVVLAGLREVPALLDCYTFLRGVNRSRRDVEVIGSAYGLDSNAGRRALLNARQTQEQAEEYWREHLPGPAGLLCAAVAGLSCLGLIVAGPVIGLRVVILRIAGRRRADPRAVTQGRADRKVRGPGHRHFRSTWAPERNDPADPLR